MDALFNRVLIAADLSEMDDLVLTFTNELLSKVNVEQVSLVHIMPDLMTISSKVKQTEDSAVPLATINGKVRTKLEEKAKQFLTRPDLKVDIEVLEGAPYEKLIEWTKLKNFDLVIVGYKNESKGSGITAKRLARNTSANVLFVSEADPTEINKTLLVPVDFSKYSAKALKTAIALNKQSDEALKVKAFHVVECMPTDYYFGLNYNLQYVEALTDNAREAMDRFLRKEGIDKALLDIQIVPNTNSSVSNQLYMGIRQERPHLVVMGAQGHSAFERFLFGSVTERLVNQNIGYSILIVR